MFTVGLVVECYHLAAIHPELPRTEVGRVDPPCRWINPAQMTSVEAESSRKEDVNGGIAQQELLTHSRYSCGHFLAAFLVAGSDMENIFEQGL